MLVALVLLAAADAATPAAPPASPPAAAGIEIAIASLAPPAGASVREDLEELLARRGLEARYRRLDWVDRDEVLRPAAQSPCSLACIWIDLGVATAGRAFVYISATASDQVVIRSLPLPSGVDEVAREEVSHIVATSVEALRAGRPLASVAERADVVAKTEPATLPPAPPDAGVWVAAGLGAGAARESADHLALPTIGLSLLVGPERARLSPAVWLQAAGFSSEASGDPVELRFRGGELAALGAIGTSPHGRAVARLGLGPGIEVRSTTPSLAGSPGASTGAELESSQIDPTLFVRAAARFEYRLFGRVGLFAALACDARVMSHRYTIIRFGTTETVFQPDRLRPSFVVGVDALLAGEAR